MLIDIILLVVGFVLLIKGADVFVEGASKVAAKFHIPEIVIGLTIVAFGTSAPEAAVSITSAFKGTAGIAVGNVIGSNICNVLLILGAAGAIEAIISIKSLQDNFVPATINYINKDDECDLNLVVNEGLNTNIEYSMSNSLGFGGHNGTLIFKKWR